MAKLFDSTKTEKGPASFSSSGKRITCSHCGGNQFESGSILLNTPGMTFFGLDWANRTATTLACTSCGKLQWFILELQRL
jgi:predicted nucleic-acid-binding Zn-ribbon protein